MRRVVTVLVGIACVVVIAAGGLWLWQQMQPAPVAPASDSGVTGTECAGYVEALQRDAATPLPEAERVAAAEGRLKCLGAGIN